MKDWTYGNEGPKAVLERERQQQSFPLEQMVYLLMGGEENAMLYAEASAFIENDPILCDHESPHDLSLPEHRERYHYLFKKILLLIKSK